MSQRKEKNTQNEHKQAKYQNKMSRISKRRLIMLVLVMGVMGSVIMQRLICTNWESLALIIYGFNRLDQPDTSLTVLSQTLLIMSISELTIALIIMSIRIGSQKISPVADNDSRSIALLNRILINNIQQSFVFFGLYAYLLIIHLPIIQAKFIFGLPLLFLLGRAIYVVSYIITTILRVATVKSIGFMFSLVLNFVIIVEIIFAYNIGMTGFLFGG